MTAPHLFRPFFSRTTHLTMGLSSPSFLPIQPSTRLTHPPIASSRSNHLLPRLPPLTKSKRWLLGNPPPLETPSTQTWALEAHVQDWLQELSSTMPLANLLMTPFILSKCPFPKSVGRGPTEPYVVYFICVLASGFMACFWHQCLNLHHSLLCISAYNLILAVLVVGPTLCCL